MTICVVSIGVTGRILADRFAAAQPAEIHPVESRIDLALLPAARLYVLAAGRQCTDAELLLDAAAFRWGSMVLPMVAEHPLLRVGPLSAPGVSGPCLTCYHHRRRQHTYPAGSEAALDRHYAAHPGDEPVGILPSTVEILCGVAGTIAECALAGDRGDCGVVRVGHTLMPYLGTTTVVGIHGCPHCGLRRSEPTRSYSELVAARVALHQMEG
jgi:bacteriocin biosynthesis cyclodehydratase domain-containing protein